jgi:peroxiredoxin
LAGQYQEFAELGTQVLAIVHDSLENAGDYFRRHDIPFPCLVDSAHTVYDAYQVESRAVSLGQRPSLFVIDQKGTVRYAHIGWQQWEIPKNDQVLAVCRTIACGAAS